ncbi:MAG: c-type cytochrome [Myxococcota bacterium]|nr:c-type cytochrome [Myxococcota bacterium]
MKTKLAMLVVVVSVIVGCTAKYVRPTTEETVEPTPQRLERGRYLVENVAMCGACHDGRASGQLLDPATPSLRLAGGHFLEDMGMAIYVPNITGDVETGLGGWSDDQIIRSIRDGVRPDGKFLFPMMPFGAYQKMSDEDVRSVVVFLRSVPKIKTPRPARENEIPFVVKTALGMGVAMHEPVKSVPAPDMGDPVKYGEYLAYMGHCTECHSLGTTGARAKNDRWMGGSDSAMEMKGVGKVWAANLTPSREHGIGNYSAQQVKDALLSGRRLDGKGMAPPMSLFTPYLTFMKPEDMDALVAYLHSLPPVEKGVPQRELSPEYQQLLDR